MIQLDKKNLYELMQWFLVPEAPPPMDIAQDKVRVAAWCFDQLFLKEPPFALDEVKVSAFEDIINKQFHRSPVRTIRYECPYPKSDFIRYLAHSQQYLLHGSSSRDIEFLEPREQTDWSGAPTVAVFASGDGIWPLFFALLNRSTWRGSIRNACLVVDLAPQESERFYFFSVNKETLAGDAWTDGVVHVLPRDTFEPTGRGPVRFDEWSSKAAVPIVARIPVSPQDFPFLGNVTGHAEDEPPLETWLRFKERQKAG
jgi:hypothetical protein